MMTDKAVIVFSFDEPDDVVVMGNIIKKAKQVFFDREGVKAALANKEAAKLIFGFLYPNEPSDSGLVEHAKRELSRLNNDADFNNSMILAVTAFASYGHSGGSASYAIPVLNDLLQFKNLTPLTDDPREWINHGEDVWQNTRNSEAFSNDGGKTYYLLSEGNPGPFYETLRSQ